MQDMPTETGRRGVPEESYDDSIHLMSLVLTVWRWRWWVLAATLVTAGAAFGIGLKTPPTYEATVKLVVTQPRPPSPNEAMPAIGVATYRALIENQSLAAKVIKEFKLDGAPWRMTPEDFLEGRLSVETVAESGVVMLRVRMPSADLAARVANRLGQLSVELAQRLNQDESVRARDSIAAQLDEARKRLDETQTRLEAFRKQSQIEALRKDVDTALGQRAGLLPLLVEIQAEKARLAMAETQLASRERIGSLKRTIESDPGLTEAAREATGGQRSLLGLATKNEFLNGVYEGLDQQVVSSRTRLSGLEKQKAELIDVRKLDASQLSFLNTLYARESELARHQTEFDLARAIYVDVSTRYEQARLLVAGRSAQLQVVDDALPPTHPTGSSVFRGTVLAAIVGFLVSAMAAIGASAVLAAVRRQQSTA